METTTRFCVNVLCSSKYQSPSVNLYNLLYLFLQRFEYNKGCPVSPSVPKAISSITATEAIFQCLLYDGYAHFIGLNSVTYIPKGLTAQEFIYKWSGGAQNEEDFMQKILNACDIEPILKDEAIYVDTQDFILKLKKYVSSSL